MQLGYQRNRDFAQLTLGNEIKASASLPTFASWALDASVVVIFRCTRQVGVAEMLLFPGQPEPQSEVAMVADSDATHAPPRACPWLAQDASTTT